ncbi:hypothetical protein RQP46_003509 [Phenoliferia psychrophenolica]
MANSQRPNSSGTTSDSPRALTGGRTGNSSARRGVGAPPPTTSRDDAAAEKRELLLAEEGGLDGLSGASKEDTDEELSEVRPPQGRKRATSGVGSRDGDWELLVTKGKEIARQWKKKWDKEGLAGVRSQLPLLTQSFSTARLSAIPPYVAALTSIIPPRRRALIAATSLIIFLFLLLRPESHKARGGPNPYHEILRGSGVVDAIVDRTTGLQRGVNKAKVLEGFSNPYGFINLIDPYAGGVFNPSVLVLPDTVGVGWRHLLVARGPERYEVIDKEDARWESVVGCFLLPLKRQYLDLPYLARESELETLKLPAERKVDYMRCHEAFIGPEDPRLFFTNDGQPLLIYSQTGRSPNICRAIYIIDARMVIPGLSKALKRGGWNAPIQFREQTDLIREGQSNIEKNWAPFLGEKDELFFHVSLVPQEIYKYQEGLTLRALDPAPPAHNCITEIVGAEMNRVKFHHATPLLRVTLCRRGECVPDIHNTVLFALIHIKYHPLPYLFYERRAVTWNVTAPYEYLSVSKPLTYSGTNQADPIFTVSMSWDHPTQKNGLGLNHGFLDDVLLTSFGVFDYGSAYIDILARDLLTDHYMCDGIPGFDLW